jgi:hypothetical protein
MTITIWTRTVLGIIGSHCCATMTSPSHAGYVPPRKSMTTGMDETIQRSFFMLEHEEHLRYAAFNRLNQIPFNK